MDREEITNEVNRVIRNKLYIDLSKLTKEQQDYSLLHPKVGLEPRDLLAIFFELQNAFNIKFEEKDIMENRFDYYNNIIYIVEEKLYKVS